MRTVTTSAAAVPVLTAQPPAGPRAPSAEPVKLATVRADAAAVPVQRFFTARQFATLERLSDLLMPALGGNPGALHAGAPAFLDFLIRESPADRQQLYRQGLDHLDAEARRLHRKPFPELDEMQASQILKPLIVPWTYDLPAQPHQRFLTAVRADVRTATTNSAEWSQANSASRRRRGAGGGFYWHPIDPRRA